jgi:hypothetical protein
LQTSIFFSAPATPPDPPYTEVGTVAEVGDALYDEERAVIHVGAVGRVRTFAVDSVDPPVFCAESRRLESPGGRVWSAATGQALDGGPSLAEHPTIVVDDVVYVDLEEPLPPQPPDDAGVEPACF